MQGEANVKSGSGARNLWLIIGILAILSLPLMLCCGVMAAGWMATTWLGISPTVSVPGAGRAETAATVGPGSTSAPANGAVVILVAPGSPADIAGVQPGDVLLSLDGNNVTSGAELDRILSGYEPGDRAQLTWWSNAEDDAGEKSAEIRFASDPQEAERAYLGINGELVTP